MPDCLPIRPLPDAGRSGDTLADQARQAKGEAIMAQASVRSTASGSEPGFRRDVGLMALMFVSLGSIIGSGWLLGALTAATSAGGASIVSWVLAGVIIVLLALVHSELGAAYPLAGGTGRWPRLAFGSLGGFTAGWVAWLQAVTIAPIEV